MSVHQAFVESHALPQGTGHSTMTILYARCGVDMLDPSVAPACEAVRFGYQANLIRNKPIT